MAFRFGYFLSLFLCPSLRVLFAFACDGFVWDGLHYSGITGFCFFHIEEFRRSVLLQFPWEPPPLFRPSFLRLLETLSGLKILSPLLFEAIHFLLLLHRTETGFRLQRPFSSISSSFSSLLLQPLSLSVSFVENILAEHLRDVNSYFASFQRYKHLFSHYNL